MNIQLVDILPGFRRRIIRLTLVSLCILPLVQAISLTSSQVMAQQMRPGSSNNQPQDPYEIIVQKSRTGGSTFSTLALPGKNGQGLLITTYRIPYTTLPFTRFRGDDNVDVQTDNRQESGSENDSGTDEENLSHPINQPSPENRASQESFRSFPTIELDIFDGSYKLNRQDKPEIAGTSVRRETRIDTVTVGSYEETRDPGKDLQGAIVTTLQPGDYHAEIRTGQRNSDKKQTLPLRNVTIPGRDAGSPAIKPSDPANSAVSSSSDTPSSSAAPSQSIKPQIVLLNHVHPHERGHRLGLLNHGSAILYREPLVVGLMLPADADPDHLILDIRASRRPLSDPANDKNVDSSRRKGQNNGGVTDRNDRRNGDSGFLDDDSPQKGHNDPGSRTGVDNPMDPSQTPLYRAKLGEFSPARLTYEGILAEDNQIILHMAADSTAEEFWVFVPVPGDHFPNTGLSITVQAITVHNDTVQNDTVQNDTLQNDTVQSDTVEHDTDHGRTTKTVASTWVQSLWKEMPRSLYNLDLSIDMLRFILSPEQLDEIKDGDFSEKEQKFRAFWKERDPTKQTEFNELMTEYYRRIDQAYEKFSTFGVKGFNSDRGRTFILMGPPETTKRIYPTNSPTREIWTYPGKRYIFEATSGFGDFRLLTTEDAG